jgi:succinoglycan biosynthesis protein ExoM
VTEPKVRIAVYAGTYKRNEPLVAMLDSILVSVRNVAETASVAMIVVDDNPDGSARQIVDQYQDKFELGIHYLHIGKGNISLVRNAGLELGVTLGDWVAMTDDDCEVCPDWLGALLAVQQRTGADAVTGTCYLRVPPGSPAWLSDQPFFEEGRVSQTDGAAMQIAATNNSMIRSSWLIKHPQVRFDIELGVLGGEDMVFFGTAHRAGLKIHFAEKAVVWGNESQARATFQYRLKSSYWLGNTICVTNLKLGTASRPRLLLRGLRSLGRSLVRPLAQAFRKQPPQMRYTVAMMAQSAGIILGSLGMRRAHH